MTSARDKLAQMHACDDALDWIGNRTIEQAWRECERSDWMCWLLERIAPDDRRCRLAAATFAERVWHMIPDEPTRLAAAWAIGAARRGDEDEMRAASMAADAAAASAASAASAADADAVAAAASAAVAAVSVAAAAVVAVAAVSVAARRAATASAAAAASAAADAADAAARSFASRADESAAQADILREYFSAREIGRLLRQAPA